MGCSLDMLKQVDFKQTPNITSTFQILQQLTSWQTEEQTQPHCDVLQGTIVPRSEFELATH